MTTDILTLLAEHTQLRRASYREFAGPCPFCGGRDRFRVWPEEGRWWCRRCERYGDAIEVLRCLHDLSFREAAALVRHGTAPPPAPPVPIDAARWQARAAALADQCREHLFDPHGAPAKEYLRHTRFLQDATMYIFRLGYNPADRWERATRWGFPPGQRDIWIPAGIVIPWEVDGVIQALKIRRLDDDAGTRYLQVRGSRTGLFGIDRLRGYHMAVLTEGEFDAILLYQHAGDLAAIVTLGGAATSLSAETRWAMRDIRTILAVYDADAAGQEAARGLAALSSRIRPYLPSGAKDITALRARGVKLRPWLERALWEVASTPLSPPAAPSPGSASDSRSHPASTPSIPAGTGAPSPIISKT